MRAAASLEPWPWTASGRGLFSAGLSSHCPAVTLGLCKPKGLLQLETVLFYSRVASLWLQAGTCHVNHRVRAGFPPSTTAGLLRAGQKARFLFQSWNTPKELFPQKDICSSEVLNGFGGTSLESQGDLLGTDGWTKTSLLGGTNSSADTHCSCPAPSLAIEPSREAGKGAQQP